MMSDIIVDFESHLRSGHAYLVETELEMLDSPDDVPSSIIADVYVVANDSHHAEFIVKCMYPDAISFITSSEPITEYEYAARRNRGIL